MKKAFFAICLAIGLTACGGGGGGGASGDSSLSSSATADAKTVTLDPTLAAQAISVVNTTAAGDQVVRSIGALADGGYTIAWLSGTTLFLQRYDNAGAKVGAEVAVPISVASTDPAVATAAIRDSSVAVLSDGTVVVAYQIDRPVGQVGAFTQVNQGIYIQKFDASGAQVLTETEVFSRLELLGPRPSFLRDPSVVALSDGGFTVAWLSDPPFLTNSSKSTLFKRRYDSQAQPVGSVVTVGSFLLLGTPGTGFSLTADAGGGYTLAISSLSDTFSMLPVSFFHYGASDAATQITAPAVGPALLLPLEGSRFALFGTGSSGSFMQFLGAAGNAVGDPISIAATPVAARELADGSFVVFWNTNGAISAQRFAANGAAMGNLLTLGSGAGSGGVVPLTAALAEGGFASAWSALGMGGDLDVFTQRFIEAITPDEPPARAKRKACLTSAKGMKGHERKAFMEACLKS